MILFLIQNSSPLIMFGIIPYIPIDFEGLYVILTELDASTYILCTMEWDLAIESCIWWNHNL